MSESDWERFSALVEQFAPMTPTHARALGLAISSLLNAAGVSRSDPGPQDWIDWDRRKTMQLLFEPEPTPQD